MTVIRDRAPARGDRYARTPPTPVAGSRRSAGHGELCVERIGERSVVTRAYASSPLRLLTPRNHGDAAWIYTSTYGGGLVDGDDIRLDVHVRAGASALLTTQASTKVYRSPQGTSMQLRGRVDAGALLVVAPDPVVPFAGASCRQAQRIDVAREGGLVLIDVLSSGRQAAGERWAFSEYHALVETAIDGRRLVHDPLALRAADGHLATRMGRFDALATVIVAGHALAAEAAALLSPAPPDPVVRRGARILRVSPLRDGGCLIRVAGTSVETIGRTIRQMLAFVPARLGDDPWARKW